MAGKPKDISKPSGLWRVGRYTAALAISLLFCLLLWNAFLSGASSLLAAYGSTVRQLEPVTAAESLNPSDPEAHYIRASLLGDSNQTPEAIEEYRVAASLRPDDYVLWQDLASALDRNGEKQDALKASQKAVELAPFYSRPRWQLGNLLLRSGRIDEAFAEMRRATFGSHSLIPNVIDLAWGLSGGDPQAVRDMIKPETSAAHIALAHFFATHGKAVEAVDEFRAAGSVSEHYRSALIDDLLTAGKFREAYDVWNLARTSAGTSPSVLDDENFQNLRSASEPGFGWQVDRDVRNVTVSQDPAGPRQEMQSLRVVWNGTPAPALPILKRLVLVEPGSRYRLRFFARTQELMTGRLPVIAIVNADTKHQGAVIAQSKPLPEGTVGWKDYAVEFSAPATTAVVIQTQRQSCQTVECPIFGITWLSGFSLEKL